MQYLFLFWVFYAEKLLSVRFSELWLVFLVIHRRWRGRLRALRYWVRAHSCRVLGLEGCECGGELLVRFLELQSLELGHFLFLGVVIGRIHWLLIHVFGGFCGVGRFVRLTFYVEIGF